MFYHAYTLVTELFTENGLLNDSLKPDDILI